LRRSLPPTNPYEEHKNKRSVREIGLTGRSTMEEKNHGERERRRELTKERRTKSPRGIELSIEENPNRHKEKTWNRETFEGGRTRLEKLFRRERVSGLFFENKHTSLTGMTYWSALANRINSTKMDMAINFDQD
jgi:hypothetical protein